MLKKSLAIILSTALALGILVQGSFAYSVGTPASPEDIIAMSNSTSQNQSTALNLWVTNGFDSGNFYYYFSLNLWEYHGVSYPTVMCASCESQFVVYNNQFYALEPFVSLNFNTISWNQVDTGIRRCYASNTPTLVNGVNLYSFSDFYLFDFSTFFTNATIWVNFSLLDHSSQAVIADHNLLASAYEPDNRYLDVYKTMSTYGNVKYLCIESDDVILSSTWVSVRFTDMYGPGTYIADYPFDYFSANGHSYIKIMPDLISGYQFTVTSVVYSGSSSWGIKEISGLDLTFNEEILPSPIPSVAPVPDYSYYDTTYINYNGGSTNIVYTPLSTELYIGHIDSDPSVSYFEDYHQTASQNVSYLVQPFSFSYIVIPAAARMNGQYYDDFLEDAIYQYDVVLDNLVYHSNPNDFDLFYGSGSWADLTSDLAAALQQGQLDVSSVLDAWYSSHDPLLLQSPFYSNGEVILVDYVGECSMILTDSFFFKQTNYLIGDTSNILTELSERLFKVDGFSDSLFQNLSSLYNLNLEYYDSSLQALTGLSYWLNDNDISSNLSDISNLLSSVDNYLSSVDGKLNYLVTIDSDLNDLLEWFQNQEDSDVTLTLPDFNPSILINIYGENVGDFVEFVQEFVNTLPEFDFSDFPNFFDYAVDLVDDTAGSGDDLIGSLFQPYDYDDSGLHEFGWD